MNIKTTKITTCVDNSLHNCSIFLLAAGTFLFCGCSEKKGTQNRDPIDKIEDTVKREPLDKIEGTFYFTSEMEFQGLDDSGVHLGPPSNQTAYLIPPDETKDGYKSKSKYTLYTQSGLVEVKGGALYVLEGAIVATRLEHAPGEAATIEDYTRLVRFTWPDARGAKSQALAKSVMGWASHHKGQRLFLVASYKVSDSSNK